MQAEKPVDFVVIFGLQKELDAFIQYFSEYERKSAHGVWYEIGVTSFDSKSRFNVRAFALNQMGNYEAASATMRAINIWNPKYIILGGISGGLKQENFNLGDLVIAEEIIAYEPGKVKNAGIERRARYLTPSRELIELARSIPVSAWVDKLLLPPPKNRRRSNAPSVHFGAVLSGEKVIAKDGWQSEINATVEAKASKLAAVEMEAFGVALSSFLSDTTPGMMMAKAICDWADSSKNDRWQEYAAHVSAAYISVLISFAGFVSQQAATTPIRVEKREYHRKSKIGLCKRMGSDWQDLADYYDIGSDRKRGFPAGRECQAIWDYLEDRNKLSSLPDALDEIDRSDLKEELIPLENE